MSYEFIDDWCRSAANDKNMSECNVVNIFWRFIDIFAMLANECELVEHCLDTGEYSTVKSSQRYVLLHQNSLRNQSDLGRLKDVFVVIILVVFFRISVG